MTNTATEATTVSTETLVSEIQVSCGKLFEGWNWREAIYYFLNGMDAGKRDILSLPTICFYIDSPSGNFCWTLELNRENETYFIGKGIDGDGGNAFTPRRATQSIYASLHDYRHVEHSLRRFARNDTVDVLFLTLDHPTISERLCLWKDPDDRRQLHILLEYTRRTLR